MSLQSKSKTELEKKNFILDSSIYPCYSSAEFVTKPNSVLLTGGTGFLGSYLLFELLQQTSAKIYCLVRAADTEQGQQRLYESLNKYSLWQEGFEERIIPVLGNLSKKRLGIPEAEFTELAQCIDTIYHNAALVNWVLPYAELEPANVQSTIELIKLACEIKVKPIHFISALSVLRNSNESTEQVLTEIDPLILPTHFVTDYTKTKWVSEKLLETAKERGIPVCVYRSGYIGGDAKKGICYEQRDFVWKFVKACIQTGVVPALEQTIDFAPVCYVSRGIIYLSLQPESEGKTFHMLNPDRPTWRDLFSLFRFYGYSLEEMEPKQWRIAFLARIQSVTDNSSRRFLSWMFSKNIPLYAPTFNCQDTISALTGSGIVCPPLDHKLIDTYCSYFISRGFLEPPTS